MSKKETVRFEVNLWVTDLHSIEIGILPYTQHEAKSRQFTKDMDICGEVKENGERSDYIAIREELWLQTEGMRKRLILKLFNTKMQWEGTAEQLMGRSIQLTHGASGLPISAYSINLAKHKQVIQLERSAYKWIGFPERFTFFLLDEDNMPRYYRIRRRWVTISQDYLLFDQQNKRVGVIDGKIIDLGGKWIVDLDADHDTDNMRSVLYLFCSILRYNSEVKRDIKRLTRQINKGQIETKLDGHETGLYMNPRRMR